MRKGGVSFGVCHAVWLVAVRRFGDITDSWMLRATRDGERHQLAREELSRASIEDYSVSSYPGEILNHKTVTFTRSSPSNAAQFELFEV